jgi:hypothetical protein
MMQTIQATFPNGDNVFADAVDFELIPFAFYCSIADMPGMKSCGILIQSIYCAKMGVEIDYAPVFIVVRVMCMEIYQQALLIYSQIYFNII